MLIPYLVRVFHLRTQPMDDLKDDSPSVAMPIPILVRVERTHGSVTNLATSVWRSRAASP